MLRACSPQTWRGLARWRPECTEHCGGRGWVVGVVGVGGLEWVRCWVERVLKGGVNEMGGDLGG